MRELRRLLVVVLVVLAVVLLPGGALVAVAVKLSADKKRVRRALREAAVRVNLDADYLDAIGYVESRWSLGAVNKAGRDGARGGAWGPTQITERTARDHGYTGDMAAFTRDPELAALWTGRILRAAADRRPLDTLADYVAAWNAGRDDADRDNDNDLDELPATHQTRRDYLPKALAALDVVRETPA